MSRYVFSLTLLLTIVWLLFSGMWTYVIILSLGAASVLVTVWLVGRMNLLGRDSEAFHMLPAALRYWPWLMGQIVLANLDVARRIFRGPASIDPRIARVRTLQQTHVGRTIMANSITLTPGTVTLKVTEQEIEYYALTAEAVEDLETGEMNRRSLRFEEDLS
ncbi:MAG: Na+/H+ antiporter subunit E [Chromatiales bacterium]|nr:Na+/H+ antiporter subunit E [Chromatiales bacterium]